MADTFIIVAMTVLCAGILLVGGIMLLLRAGRKIKAASSQASPVRRTPAQKMQLAVVLMVFPWFIICVLSGLMQSLLFNGLTLPASNGIASTVFSQTETTTNGIPGSGPLHGETRMGISEIRDSAGNKVMPGQPIVLVCPGDTLTFFLYMDGHVADFSLTDPATGQSLFVNNSPANNVAVQPSAHITVHIPAEASAGDTLRYPWNGLVDIITKTGESNNSQVKTELFMVVAQFSESGTAEITLVTPETRDGYMRGVEANATTSLLRYLGLAVLFAAGIFLFRKHFIPMLTILASFGGLAFYGVFNGSLAQHGVVGIREAGFFCITIAVVMLTYLVVRKYNQGMLHIFDAKNISTTPSKKYDPITGR